MGNLLDLLQPAQTCRSNLEDHVLLDMMFLTCLAIVAIIVILKISMSISVNKTERINNYLSNFFAVVRNNRINIASDVQKSNTHLVGRLGIQSVPQLATARICSASSFCFS